MKKKNFFKCLVAMEVLLGTTGAANAEVTWSYDAPTTTLTISGTGAMSDYDFTGDPEHTSAPWGTYYSQITSVVIEQGVTSISEHAFSGCSALKKLIIEEGTTALQVANYSIETGRKGAFYNCAIDALYLGRNFNRMNSTYSSTFSVKQVTISNSVTTIGSYDFSSSAGGSVEKLIIEDGTTALQVANYSNGVFHGEAFYNCPIRTLYLGRNITISGDSAPFGTVLEQVTIGNSVTAISSYTFSGCSGLFGALTIPNGVKSIGERAFYGCSGLFGALTIPNDVTSIGEGAFYGCRGLFGALTIPNGVTSIGEKAFFNCLGLTAINVDAANTQYSSVDGVLYDKNQTTLMVCPVGKSGMLSIPNSVTSIEQSAFFGCNGLTSVTIPNNVTSIGEGAFSGCSGLTSITNLKTAPQPIQSNVFDGVANLTLYVPFSGANAYRTAAVWKDFGHILNIYTVTFNARGGSNVSSQQVTEGNKFTSPTAPTRDGYTFGGWYYELACTNEWFFDSDLPTSDITLYAKWTEATAIETTEEADNLTVYPNPTKGEIFIRSELPIEKVEIFDISGRTVETWRAASLQQGNLQTINVSHLPKGVYLVKIFTAGRSITKKIIKE